MRNYRLYFLDVNDRIIRAEIVSGADDTAAVAAAVERDHAHFIEMWEGTRRVGSVDPLTGQLVDIRSRPDPTVGGSSRRSLA
jgi:hypothetical protein